MAAASAESGGELERMHDVLARQKAAQRPLPIAKPLSNFAWSNFARPPAFRSHWPPCTDAKKVYRL